MPAANKEDLKNVAIIGRIPGYNKNIDSNQQFEKELLKGITFIDLIPTSYVSSFTNTETTNLYDYLKAASTTIFSEGALFKKDESAMVNYKSLLARMLPENEGEIKSNSNMGLLKIFKGFSDVEMLRIIAANDSTFVENYSNDATGMSLVDKFYSGLKENEIVKTLSTFTNITKVMDYSEAQKLLMGPLFGSGNGSLDALESFAQGVAFNANLATPTTWSSSSYSTTLSIFIKLISPIGSPQCITKNIIIPLLYLIAAASPVTSYGLFYGAPMLWEIDAKGVTNIRLGIISSMSVIRGSFETTFTKDLQPTVLDVRLNFSSMLNDFASQSLSDAPSLYTEDARKNFSVVTPYDTYRGTMNSGTDAHKILTTTINL